MSNFAPLGWRAVSRRLRYFLAPGSSPIWMKDIDSSSSLRSRCVHATISLSAASPLSGEPSVMTRMVSSLPPFSKCSLNALLRTPARSVVPPGRYWLNSDRTRRSSLTFLSTLCWSEKNHTVTPSGSALQTAGASSSTASLADSHRDFFPSLVPPVLCVDTTA
eukprot:TRINITY_DN1692_c1_g1_i3.p1 TRINITY_DN1692_c1_g1~~TRINITY_DN1692_c1_g1_i3.p1  ORF type:complete len:163 (+),score=18.72 TRINITY_DN1692_c1_g1_i3:145-633(+)